MSTYGSLVVSDDERSAEPLGVGDLVLLTLDLFGMTRFGFNSGFAVFTSEVRVIQEVAVALHTTIGKLQINMKLTFFRICKNKIEANKYYLDDYGALIDALNDDAALQFNYSILLLKIVHASCGATGVFVHVLSARNPS